LLNSTDIQGKLSTGGGRCQQLAADTQKTDAEKVTELYFAALSRPPRADELQLVQAYLDRQPSKQQAFEDVLWALFNTKEFLFVR
jgi:hypothetical protein